MTPLDISAVHNERDPLKRAKLATGLIVAYQEKIAELSELRRFAIQAAHDEHDMTYTQVAAALGITKGRLSQILNGS